MWKMNGPPEGEIMEANVVVGTGVQGEEI